MSENGPGVSCKGLAGPACGDLRVSAAMIIVCLAAFSFVPETAFPRDYEIRRRSGEYSIEVNINRNPPVTGENMALVRIRDRMGRYVRGARVKVNYSMPPMPGMPPMNYTTSARASGDAYLAAMNIIMRGPWNIVVTFRDRTSLGRVVFPIDVR